MSDYQEIDYKCRLFLSFKNMKGDIHVTVHQKNYPDMKYLR